MFTLQEHKEMVQRGTFLDFLNELLQGISFATKEAFFEWF